MQSVHSKVPVRVRGLAQSPQPGPAVSPSTQSSVCVPSMVSAISSSCRISPSEAQGTPASAFVGKSRPPAVPRNEFSTCSVPEFVARQLQPCVSSSSVSQSRCSAYVTGQLGASSPKPVLARAFERSRQTAVSSKFQSMRQRFAVPRSSFEVEPPFMS